MQHSSLWQSDTLRLGGFYAVNFAVLGAFVPYRGRYFDARGFDSFTIGLAMALMSLATIAAPYAWASLADRFQARKRILLIGCFGALCALSLALYARSTAMLLLALVGYGMFWNAILPQMEVLTLSRAAQGGADYSRIRLWGSFGYIFSVLLAGYAIEHTGIVALALVLLPLTLMMCGVALRIPDATPPARDAGAHLPMWPHVRQPAVLAFFVAAMLVSASHAPYYTFFDLYLRYNGYSASGSGWLITLGVVAEIFLFWHARHLLARYSLRVLLFTTLAISTLRWSLLAFGVQLLPLMLLVQLMHAVSFALQHATAMHFLHNQFPSGLHARAQALYSAMAYGIGGAGGNLLSGWLWQGGRGGQATYLMSATACAIGLLLIAVALRRLPESDRLSSH